MFVFSCVVKIVGWSMNISQASQACGLPTKTIRFYEEIGLVVPERQASNSYRIYAMADIERLRFLQRARAVGFGLDECRQLLMFYGDAGQRDLEAKALLSEYLLRLDQQFIALNSMRTSLELMIAECAFDHTAAIAQSDVKKLPPQIAFTLIETGRD
jgi:MerR family copper efflux transcriptional regulator